MHPDLSVIVVSYQCAEALTDCLESLAGCPWGVSTEVIVIDNGSTDGTADRVRRRFSGVRLIANAANRGFAAANNQGLAVAGGRHILFLNPDTRVHPGALDRIVEALDADATIGALGPQLVDANGAIQPSTRGFPTWTSLLHRHTPLRLLGVLGGAYRRYRMTGFDFTRPADVDQVMGAAMAMPRAVLDRVGTMDERFFLYFEEVDLCRRIKAAGYRVRFDPSGQITHTGGESTAAVASHHLLYRGLFKYVRKWHGPLTGRLMVAVLWAGMIVRELGLLATNLGAAGVMAAFGRRDASRRRMNHARLAARFVGRDAWRAIRSEDRPPGP
jgi:GT2 family glycosyltransferase